MEQVVSILRQKEQSMQRWRYAKKKAVYYGEISGLLGE